MMKELAQDLTQSGHSVVVLTGWPNHPQGVLYDGWRARWRDVSKEFGIRLVRCGHSIRPGSRVSARLWTYFTFAVTTLFNGLREGPCDLVLCLSSPVFGAWSAWLLARAKRARFVYDIFDLHPEATRNAGLIKEASLVYRLWRRQDTLLCKCSDAILTLSDEMKLAISERGIDIDTVTVVPFWIDPARIAPRSRINPWRRKHGIPDETFVALFAGTIGHISGVGILADAAKLLSSRHDIRILCVGEGVAKDALQRKMKAATLANITFLPFQPEEDLANMQAVADVGLVTLLPGVGRTSVPSKVLGYMAAARPVIASVADDSATAGMLRDAGCGIVTPPCDALALAHAIREACDHRTDFDRLGEAGRAYIVRQFSRQACTHRYEDVFRDLTR